MALAHGPDPIHLAAIMCDPSSQRQLEVQGSLQSDQGSPLDTRQLFELLYHELRVTAENYLNSERLGHTLQPTALVNEVWLRIGATGLHVNDRDHFLALAAQAMRRILTDHARAKNTDKRGGGVEKATLQQGTLQVAETEADLIELDESLERLERHHERASRVFVWRAFGGLSVQAISGMLQMSEMTVRRDWDFARLWLLREMDV